MNKLFLSWVRENESLLNKMGIKTEYNYQWDTPAHALNPSTVIDQETSLCVGRVIVWSTKQMHFEVFLLESESIEPILMKDVELDEGVNFYNILEEYFKIMVTGTSE